MLALGLLVGSAAAAWAQSGSGMTGLDTLGERTAGREGPGSAPEPPRRTPRRDARSPLHRGPGTGYSGAQSAPENGPVDGGAPDAGR